MAKTERSMHMSVKLRGIVILMAALVCFALLFSCFFMAYESGHNCCQERCAICCLVSFYRSLIKTVCTVLIVLGVVMAVFCSLWFLGEEIPVLRICPTLVVNKVKLSN